MAVNPEADDNSVSRAGPGQQTRVNAFLPDQWPTWWLSCNEPACQPGRRKRHGFNPWVGEGSLEVAVL